MGMKGRKSRKPAGRTGFAPVDKAIDALREAGKAADGKWSEARALKALDVRGEGDGAAVTQMAVVAAGLAGGLTPAQVAPALEAAFGTRSAGPNAAWYASRIRAAKKGKKGKGKKGKGKAKTGAAG